MKFASEEMERNWAKGVEVNSDPYGACVYRNAYSWAVEMEDRIAKGAALADIAEETSREVDRRPGFGITGFMYGAAVSLLSHAWAHGEELRRWHNLKTQLGDEGERANREGGTLNPALLRVGRTGWRRTNGWIRAALEEL